MHQPEKDSKDKYDLCGNAIQDCNDRVRLTEKGANSIKEASRQRRLSIYINVCQVVHSSCENNYANKKDILVKRGNHRRLMSILLYLDLNSLHSNS